MKKNRKRKKKTFLLIWFFLVALLLTTGTYAWFSSNRIVYIEFFNVHVETDGGMQISADASNWKTLVEIEELATIHETTYPDSVNQLPSSMNPVSTAGSIDRNTGYLKMYYGAMENDGLDSYVLSTFRDTETRGFGLESSGNLSIFKKDSKLLGEYPLPIILDGEIDYDTLRQLDINEEWIIRYLKKDNLGIKDIFYAFYRENSLFLIKKDDLRK